MGGGVVVAMNKAQLVFLRQAFDDLDSATERRFHVRQAIEAQFQNPKVEIAVHGRRQSFEIPLPELLRWCEAEVSAAENVVKERGGEP